MSREPVIISTQICVNFANCPLDITRKIATALTLHTVNKLRSKIYIYKAIIYYRSQSVSHTFNISMYVVCDISAYTY